MSIHDPDHWRQVFANDPVRLAAHDRQEAKLRADRRAANERMLIRSQTKELVFVLTARVERGEPLPQDPVSD